MQEFALGFREVIPDQTVLDSWKEISRNTGGTQGTLQDIKVAERANGYCYFDTAKYYTRNRFIYWRINHDVLELVEHSLDINLAGNRIRYKFVDTPILDGVSVHETCENVIILVPTVCSVHRLIFPHPDKFHRQDDLSSLQPDLAAYSIFSDAKHTDSLDPSTYHFFTNNSNSQLPYLAASSLSLAEEEAIFVLAYPSGEILVVKQSREGKIGISELKNETIVPRFLSDLADKLRQKDKDEEITSSLLIYTFGLETYVITLCRNGNIKFWSCSRNECVAVINIFSECGVIPRQMQEAQNFVLKKAVNDEDSTCLLAVYMSFANDSQIHILRPVINGPNIRLHRFKTLHQPQNDLIDLTLSTSAIWSVWRGNDGECQVMTASIQTTTQWCPVVLESVPDAEPTFVLDGEFDPKQIYLQQIFHPGRFPLHIISKALNIFKRSNIIGELNLSATHLKQQLCAAVEEEIQNELKDSDITEANYLESANYCWQQFYSCCIQYHVAGLKPLGLLLLPNASGAVLLKKSMISFLRPFDVFEHLMFKTDSIFEDQFDFLISENIDISEDLLNLFKVLNYLDQQVSENFALTFEREMSLLKKPDAVMNSLLHKIVTEMDAEFTQQALQMLTNCQDLYQAIHKVLELLRVDYQIESDECEHPPLFNQIFASQLGVSVVVGCLRQQIQIRFDICRNLLLLLTILLKDMKFKTLDAIRHVCMPEIVVLTNAHYAMLWLSGLTALNSLPTETTMQRLSSLNLSPVFNIRTNSLNSISLLELFVGSNGGYEARKVFARYRHNEETLAQWHLSLLPFLNCIFHTLWPVSGTPILYEWLLTSGQHLWLQQLVRYLKNWCEWNINSYIFFLATSLLVCGETTKALQLYQSNAKNVGNDKLLSMRIGIADSNPNQISINYFLKVIHLFELHKAFDCAIKLANSALTFTSANDPIAATLYSVKFKHHLTLKNYTLAYRALMSNPDSERKKDNLRDLVKNLLDERKFIVLMDFTYQGMEELFCDIIFTRARATDATNNVFYDFLYSYQLKRGPAFYRSAASIMYEQGYRLSQYSNPEALEKQVKCYLAAKNCLHLVDSKYAYVVMPSDNLEEHVEELPAEYGTDSEPTKLVLKSQVRVLEIDDIKKELAFCAAKLNLFKLNPNVFFEITTTHELVILLTNAGLFKTALQLAQMYDLPYSSIFESLTKRCSYLDNNENDSNAWHWLIENNLQDLPVNTKSPSAAAWNLLEELIKKYELEKLSELHRVVCNQIIKLNLFIPQWLMTSYKKRNPSELLRLLYNGGRFDEAIEVASGYMLAAMGYGMDHYGFTHGIQVVTPPVCMPVHIIMMLIHQLKYINEDNAEKPFLQEYEHLSDVLSTYLKTVQKTSNEMISYKYNLLKN